MEQVSEGTASRARLTVWRGGLTFWSSSADAPRERRPTDVGVAVAGLVVLALLSVAAPGPTDVDAKVAKVIASFPGLLTWLWESGYAAALLWAVVLMLAAVVTRHRRVLVVEQVGAAGARPPLHVSRSGSGHAVA
jgi:hypothetical protein